MYNERAPLYEKYADITVNVSQAELSDSLDKIAEKLAALG
jgi:shikimate kinase